MVLGCLYFSFAFLVAWATIDVNLPEYEYLSDKLRTEECRMLITALHVHNTQMDKLEQAERMVPKELTCLQMLLHWNSARNEGRGETHQVLQERLSQIGRRDLAEWLSKTVFHQLSKELNRSINEPFDTLINDTESTTKYEPQMTLFPPIENVDVSEWTPFDTIASTLLLLLIVVLVVAIVKVLWRTCCQKCTRRHTRPEDTYARVETETETESESDY